MTNKRNLWERAHAHLASDRRAEALAAFALAHDAAPEAAETADLMAWASVLRARGHLLAATRHMRMAHERDRDSVQVACTLGDLLRDLGNAAEARVVLERAIARCADPAQRIALLRRFAGLQRHFDTGTAAVERWLQGLPEPEQGELRLRWGTELARSGLEALAMAQFERAIAPLAWRADAVIAGADHAASTRGGPAGIRILLQGLEHSSDPQAQAALHEQLAEHLLAGDNRPEAFAHAKAALELGGASERRADLLACSAATLGEVPQLSESVLAELTAACQRDAWIYRPQLERAKLVLARAALDRKSAPGSLALALAFELAPSDAQGAWDVLVRGLGQIRFVDAPIVEALLDTRGFLEALDAWLEAKLATLEPRSAAILAQWIETREPRLSLRLLERALRAGRPEDLPSHCDRLAALRHPLQGQAQKLIEDLAKTSQDAAGVYWRWATALARSGSPHAALEWYRRARSAGSDATELLLEQATALFDSSSYDEALKLVRHVLALEPQSLAACDRLAAWCARRGDAAEAAAAIAKAIRLDPSTVDRYRQLARMLVQLDDPGGIVAGLRELHETTDDPTRLDAQAWVFAAAGEREAAATVCLRALSMNPLSSIDGSLARVLALFRLGDPIFTRVEALLAKLDCGQAFLAWGRITSSFGLVGQALAAFEAAGKHFDSAGLHYQWGRALLDADQPSAALERLWMARTRSTEPGNTALLEWIDGDIARAQLARTPDHDLLRLAITRLRDLERHTTSPVARFWARFSAAAGFDQHGSIDQALEGYHALDLEFPAHPFPIHNTWSIRSQQGQYSAAEDSRKKALAKYEALYEDWRRSLTPGDATLRLPELGSEGQNPFEEASGFTYYAWCLLPEVASSDPKAAERTRQLVMRLCRQGQRMNSNHVPLLTVLVRLHLDKEVGGVEHATDAERAESFVAHRRAIETMRAQLESFPVARVYAALGHLHLLSGDVEAASTALKKAVELDPSSSESHTRLGAALARADDHPKAIRQFEAALSCRPSNLDASSNLAESCLKVGDRARARKEYESILRLAPQHIESLIGLSELEVAEGDSLRAIDPQAALAAQARAAGRLKRVLECCRNGHGSKRLSAKEIGDVEYSLGYIAAMQYEVSGRADDGLLQEALERFKEVPARHASSEKAAAAIARIEERTSRVRSLLSIESLGPVLAAALALLVFLTTQVFQLVRVEWVPSHYALGAPALAELIAAGVDVKTLEELGALAGAATADARLDRSELVRALEKALGSKRAAKYGKAILKVAKVESGFHAVRPVAPEIYLMLTFGSLLFMIAGLYMRHVLKLKIGPIELEKAALDQITAPSSLNISR